MRVDDETMKRPLVARRSMARAPQPDVAPHGPAPMHSRPADRSADDTPMLAAISGITPLPVPTQAEPMIDAAWFRRFHATLDRLSGGRAAQIIPLISFVVIGGSAALVNLAIVFAFDVLDHAHHNLPVQHLIYSAIATEVSLLYNFLLNDRFTFRALVDQRRTWLQRCIRFHGPASVGFGLTLALSSLFLLTTRQVTPNGIISPSLAALIMKHNGVVAQAMAIALVMVVNFTMHRFWTYRPRKDAVAAAH